ncbi:MAG: sugar phosphate isomerase/epimerase [Bacteroidota bacterium]|nr:sugar phosphate isomerase/epimerase [Bacteroidota bacterium]
MNTSRRKFLKTGTIAVAGTIALPQVLRAATNKTEAVGVQLYSVRDDMKTDPMGTLKKVAAAGYKNVEHANYVDRKFYGYTATEFKKVLSDVGLKMPSGHVVMTPADWDENKKDFTDKWKITVEDAATVGQSYLISPWLDDSLRKDMTSFKNYMGVFNKCGELCKRHGLKYGYHNHDFEFNTKIDGVLLYDLILKNTDPSLVAQQIDMGNMYGAGGRALDIIKQYPGRFELMHVKDEIKSAKGEMGDGYESTILGKGVIPVKEIVEAGRKTGGTTQFIVEQESYQGKAPIDCIKEDLQILNSWGFR